MKSTRPKLWAIRVGRAVTLVGCLYGAGAAVLLSVEDELVFRPKPHPDFWHDPPKNSAVVELTLPSSDGRPAQAWWLEPKGWTPERGVLLHCHGHGCNLSHLGAAALKWRDAFQRAVLLIDYPGFGHCPGPPSEAGCYAAAAAAFDWLREHKQTTDIVVYGHSMGGAVAIDLAANRPVSALIVTSTFTTMPDAAAVLLPIYPTAWLMKNRFDSLAKIPKCAAPTFIAHGTADRRVPFGQGQRLFAASGAKHKSFRAIENGRHDLINCPEVIAAAAQFLADLRRDSS